MPDATPSTPSREEWIALRSKVWDAQKLARTILGRDATELTGTDMLQAIRTFAAMKEELQQLQRESQLTKQALVATQCSQSYISKRLEKLADLTSPDGNPETSTMDSSPDDAALPEQAPELDTVEVSDPEANLEQEIMMILPTKSKSLGVGLLGDMEQCIVEWQSTFEQLNDQHEFQVQACQADLERLHVRLDTMKALNPTGVEAAAAAKKARDQLEKLVKIVEAFPSRARVEALQRELEDSKRAEQESHEELARAMQELEAVRRREQDLLRRLEEAESSREELESSLAERNNRKLSTRLLHYTKKKMQRLFRLDRSIRRRQQGDAMENAPENGSQNVASSTYQSTTDDANLESSSVSGLSNSSEASNAHRADSTIDLRNLDSNEDDLLLVFCSSDHDSSDDEVDQSQEDWSVDDTLDANNRQDVLLAHSGKFSPSKISPSSSTDECDLDISKMNANDSILSEAASFVTDATTNSSSWTPPSKLASKRPKELSEAASEKEGKSLFAKAKSLLWLH